MTLNNQTVDTRCVSSLAKVFADEEIVDRAFHKASALTNETYSFQVAYRVNDPAITSLKVRVDSDLQEVITVRKVGLVKSEFPMYDDHDEHVLRATPGFYPDPLFPLDNESLEITPKEWHAVWLTVKLHPGIVAGAHPIHVRLETDVGETVGSETFELEVLPVQLPEQKLISTQWFHADCIATEYGVEALSERHWELIDLYVETAANHGMNMLLTPLFTLPLDTEIGEERPTVQLIDVEKTGDQYVFGFDKLNRWIEMAFNRGIKYIEFSHLYTQWGVAHAPKIVATEDGQLKKIFGWETEAQGEPYRQFLMQFLPRLVDFIKEKGIDKQVYFHVSDEPSLGSLDAYKQASDLLHKYLSDYPIIDALSDYGFYEKGLVKKPIPANNHLEDFITHKVPELWTYYCCSQYKKVPNHFFCFPSARNRISGMQFYKHEIVGFLHWGYNFWYSRQSRRSIDPFTNTDADKGFPSGDAFLVYPGKEGPIESIRFEVFYDVIQDLGALQLLESLIGRASVIELIEGTLAQPITFEEYPRESEWLLEKREVINKAILEASKSV